VRADGVTDREYTYETAGGRLKTVTDPMQQVFTYTYNVDDTVQQMVITNASVATPTVSFTYDAIYGRLATRTDGLGVTTYGYKAVGVLGATDVASVDGPFTGDTVTFDYDHVGRVSGRSVNGVSASQTRDALGRIETEVTPLGTFTYTYDGLTRRKSSLQYPNGQTAAFTYFSAAGNHRLQTTHHRRADNSTLSKFDYTYDTVGNVSTWREQTDANPAVEWRFGYDAADQMLAAVRWSTDPIPVMLKRYGFGYDAGGNRTSVQEDDAVMESVFDSLNRLVTLQPGGAIRVAGAVNEPATVAIQGRQAGGEHGRDDDLLHIRSARRDRLRTVHDRSLEECA
jgi:hypothetical protein